MNPLIPSAFDVVMTLVLLIALGLSFAAFISMIRTEALTGWRFLLWALAAFLLPVVGATAWFTTTRRERAERFMRRGATR